MSRLVEHAKMELELAGWYDKESDYSGMIPGAVVEIITVFAKQGHTRGSASIVRALTAKLMDFDVLSPLTGEDHEWVDVCESGRVEHWQNIRCSRVFKDLDGAYDVHGRIFRKPDGSTFVSEKSRVQITFPYVPKTEIVDVQALDPKI